MSHEFSNEQLEVFRRMTPSQKFRAAFQLRASAIELKKAYLRGLGPRLSEQEIEKQIRDWLLYGTS